MEYQEFYDFIVKVHSIAKIGLTFSKDPYALENYQQLNDLSRDMLEKFTYVKFDKPSMFSRDIYPTPNISVRTLIPNEKGELLMVREANSGLWSFPGGWCDLYDSPSEAAFNEVSQEAGIEPKITRVIGILERTPYKSNQNVPEYVLLFEGSIDGKKFHDHCHETTEVGFFDINHLPEMSKKLSMTEINRILKAYKNKEVIFD